MCFRSQVRASVSKFGMTRTPYTVHSRQILLLDTEKATSAEPSSVYHVILHPSKRSTNGLLMINCRLDSLGSSLRWSSSTILDGLSSPGVRQRRIHGIGRSFPREHLIRVPKINYDFSSFTTIDPEVMTQCWFPFALPSVSRLRLPTHATQLPFPTRCQILTCRMSDGRWL